MNGLSQQEKVEAIISSEPVRLRNNMAIVLSRIVDRWNKLLFKEKLDGVRPIDKRLSPPPKKNNLKHVTHDMWQVTCDTW